MIKNSELKPGSLIRLRNREWIVLPSPDEEILKIKPLGGFDEEITGIYLPLDLSDERPEPAEFPAPAITQSGNFSSARLLYNAARFSFRNTAGPFRSIGKISFRPRAYQIVPLIMALKLDPVRLFIADDVGIGKTIEALLIVRELLDRGEISRFAVVCLPHLCEQWQQELKDKFSLDAVIIRSSTAGQLDRQIKGDGSVFREYPYQVISIDFIKSEPKKSVFLSEAPELIIVDEAHTCAKPAGVGNNQHQRFNLINDLAKSGDKHIILLTATPHSGKQQEFQSLLGLLNMQFEKIDLVSADQNFRKLVASHLVIRRRADIQSTSESTPFPERESAEIEYTLSPEYKNILNGLLDFARRVSGSQANNKGKFRYLAVLSLLRGVLSSPRAGIEMLSKKTGTKTDEANEEFTPDLTNFYDRDDTGSDFLPVEFISKAEISSGEINFLKSVASNLSDAQDNKAIYTIKLVNELLRDNYNPIIFCRFIETAEYLGEFIRERLPQNTDLLVITGLMVDEQRREKIAEFDESPHRRVLVATDCLSEGINLQKYFNAVIHYDLPWNPNRLEQREGRVDRFGQTSSKVRTFLIWGKDNPIDSVVLNVLLRKAKEIKRQTGISVPFPDDSQSILDSLINAVILNPNIKEDDEGLLPLVFPDDDITEKELEVSRIYEEAAERNKATRSIFAQNTIKIADIEQDLREIDLNVGNPSAVEDFVLESVMTTGAQISRLKAGYRLFTTNLPPVLKSLFSTEVVLICFDSPVADGFQYVGRNSRFVEHLSHLILSGSVYPEKALIRGARVSVIPSKQVHIKTVIIQLRCRIIISDKYNGRQVIAEEMVLSGYEGAFPSKNYISHEECEKMFEQIIPAADFSEQRQEAAFEAEAKQIFTNKDILTDIARERAKLLIEAHERYRKLIGGRRYEVAEPVVPPDILGIYIIFPHIQ